jgi:hypothetical protein
MTKSEPRPSAADIKAAIDKLATGAWINPDRQPGTYWCADLINPAGRKVMDGVAETEAEAMGLAWANAFSPDALETRRIRPTPLDTAGYRFVLTRETFVDEPSAEVIPFRGR